MPSSPFGKFDWLDPTTWPWFLYLWLAFAAAGFVKPAWKWYQRHRANSWPPVEGRIEATEVNDPGWLFMRNSHTQIAQIHYSYSAQGATYSGIYKRGFASEDEAWEFVRDLKGMTVTVLSNPDRPSISTLSEASLDALLQTRAPDPYPKPPVEVVPAWLRPWLRVFMVLYLVGLVLSLWVHFGAVMGRRVAPDSMFSLLHIGTFLVFAPAAYVSYRQVGNTNGKDFWKVILKGAPDGMRYVVSRSSSTPGSISCCSSPKCPMETLETASRPSSGAGFPAIGWCSIPPPSLFSVR